MQFDCFIMKRKKKSRSIEFCRRNGINEAVQDGDAMIMTMTAIGGRGRLLYLIRRAKSTIKVNKKNNRGKNRGEKGKSKKFKRIWG